MIPTCIAGVTNINLRSKILLIRVRNKEVQVMVIVKDIVKFCSFPSHCVRTQKQNFIKNQINTKKKSIKVWRKFLKFFNLQPCSSEHRHICAQIAFQTSTRKTRRAIDTHIEYAHSSAQTFL